MIVINLIQNQLSGHLPSTMGCTLPNLERLTLSHNKLSGTIPNSIINASKLITLNLGYNYFSGLIPNTFGNLRFLNWLSPVQNYLMTKPLAANPLRGFLPSLVSNFSASLQEFNAYGCELKGSIPQEIGNLSGLIVLNLFNNDLIGTIPKTVGGLQQLQGLDLFGNNLQGSIPYDLCNLKRLYSLLLQGLVSLRELYLDSNKLSSSIPSSFWNLEYILQIDLSSNSLSGSLLPHIQKLKQQSLRKNSQVIGALPHLKQLNLSYNRLEGEIPIKGPFRNFSTQSCFGNYALGSPPILQVPPYKEDNGEGTEKAIVLVLKYILPRLYPSY
ncbi:hypothetical protein CISIN_1g040487mg [Citrus sinensis]|uniref:Leucine-rich repeat-containing N-terminal plant-type domain-containing protein n=1 Tax=Citrus sinensis TaxID=2711 RepID=A0A067EF08_CITSI|nr:hypothetical protein CISIN_1g040487mg [Citrus sinensis]